MVELCRSLSDAIPVEKLAAIKAKRLANKRAMIRHSDDDATAVADLQNVADNESDGLLEILARERVSRTRSDITKGQKDLTARLAPIFAMIKAKEEGKRNDANKPSPIKVCSLVKGLGQFQFGERCGFSALHIYCQTSRRTGVVQSLRSGAIQ